LPDSIMVQYDPFTRGVEEDVWIKNPDGSLYSGQVWPGYTVTVFLDWFSENILSLTGEEGTGANYSALALISVANMVISEYLEW
ncbi:hypothetical protein EDB19DRAFT_1719065, partial [Suillus lakei]